MLRKDKEEVEAIKHAKALEAEKAMYSVSEIKSTEGFALRDCCKQLLFFF